MRVATKTLYARLADAQAARRYFLTYLQQNMSAQPVEVVVSTWEDEAGA